MIGEGNYHKLRELSNRTILDACCGSRMFWFNKNHPDVIYADIRDECHTLCDGRELHIEPDIVMDFRNMPFDDERFKMVVFDPPHLINLGKGSWMSKKYGVLELGWKDDIKKGFNECWRVLKKNGTLIFKWSEKDITVKEVLKLFEEEPLFGHTTGRSGKTKWICWIKS